VTDGARHAIASDGRVSYGDTIVHEAASKIVRFGDEVIVGLSGHARSLQILQRRADAGYVPATALEFAASFKLLLEENGYNLGSLDDVIPFSGEELVYLTTSGAWVIGSDFTVFPIESSAAVGSGGQYASGAAAALVATSEASVEEIAIMAVHIAGQMNSGTGGNIQVAVLGESPLSPTWVDDI